MTGSTNVNLQNWSRAMLIFVAIGILFSIIAGVLGVTIIGGALEGIRQLLENVDVQNGAIIQR